MPTRLKDVKSLPELGTLLRSERQDVMHSDKLGISKRRVELVSQCSERPLDRTCFIITHP